MSDNKRAIRFHKKSSSLPPPFHKTKKKKDLIFSAAHNDLVLTLALKQLLSEQAGNSFLLIAEIIRKCFMHGFYTADAVH